MAVTWSPFDDSVTSEGDELRRHFIWLGVILGRPPPKWAPMDVRAAYGLDVFLRWCSTEEP